jgi:hypothetical protein
MKLFSLLHLLFFLLHDVIILFHDDCSQTELWKAITAHPFVVPTKSHLSSSTTEVVQEKKIESM